MSETEAIYLYGLDIIAEQLAGSQRHYRVHQAAETDKGAVTLRGKEGIS